jgi:hypothetical protein
MPIYSIIHRWTRDVAAAVEAPTFSRALELAVRRGMCLTDIDLEGAELPSAFLGRADLRGAGLAGAELAGCYFRAADLRRADLRGARLVRAFLRGADLRRANLRHADLRHADLREARLVGADLRGVIVAGARLADAICDWRWSAIPLELLRQHRRAASEDLRLVVDLAFHDDSTPFGWLKRLAGHGVCADWALGALAHSVRDGDNAPELLRSRTGHRGAAWKASIMPSAVIAASTASGTAASPERPRRPSGAEDEQDIQPEALADAPLYPRLLWRRRHKTSGPRSPTIATT